MTASAQLAPTTANPLAATLAAGSFRDATRVAATRAELILAMTHEETVTTHVAREVRSYRDLPLILYHFQIKERDEPRPRAGVLRTREFVMKDAYSFDRDEEGLRASYARFVEAYDRIFDRSGLEWYRVESDVGAMGGFGAHEYMAPCPAGENDVALAPGYAANVEVATADAQPVELPAGIEAPELVDDGHRQRERELGRDGLRHDADQQPCQRHPQVRPEREAVLEQHRADRPHGAPDHHAGRRRQVAPGERVAGRARHRGEPQLERLPR